MKTRIENEVLYTALHPSRREILEAIANDPKKKSYALKLEQVLGMNRKVVTFHLAQLQKYGLVEGEFGLKNEPDTRPVAVKYFSLTKKGQNMLSIIQKLHQP